MEIKRISHEDLEREEREMWKKMSPQERLALMEDLRLDAGKLGIYDYPCRLQRIITVTRKAQS